MAGIEQQDSAASENRPERGPRRRRAVAANAVVTFGFAFAQFGTLEHVAPFAANSTALNAALCLGFLVAYAVALRGIAIRSNRRSRAAAAARDRDYRTIVENNPAKMLRFRGDGAITFANETYCRFHGLTVEAILRKTVYELIRGPEAEATRRELRRLLAGPGPYAFLAPCEDERGVEVWIDWNARRLESGEFHAVGLDVTDRRTAESELRRLEKTRHETQKQESLGLIAGSLAHDYNNLLTGILGHAEIARDLLAENAPARPHLERIMESSRRIAEANRQLLAFAGEGKIFLERVDLHAHIRGAVADLAADAPPNCEWEFQLSDEPAVISGDIPQISLAIRSVFLNAIQAAVPGRLNHITVRTQFQDYGPDDFRDTLSGRPAPAKAILLTVFDTGSGIDDETLAKIFDPFFSTRSLGRGLGLSAVHRIVAEHGGALRIDSEPGRGTTVRIAWPAAPAPETAAEISTSVIPGAANAERRSVLIIDDEESVRMLLAQMVGQLGWEALSAESGLGGIEAYRGNVGRIAFVILDMMMPDLDGLAVQAALREIRPGLPILFCTGYSREMLSTDTPSGPSGVLLKPFRLGELRAAIGVLLRDTVAAS